MYFLSKLFHLLFGIGQFSLNYLKLKKNMQQLSKYDPYAIKQIQFFIQKKAKYTTLKSIIISLFIFSLTIVVSFPSLQNIWIPTSQLDVESANVRLSSSQFTSNYICVISQDFINKAPNSTLSNIDAKTNLSIKSFSVTNKFDKIPEIIQVANGRNFYCYDSQGAVLNANTKLVLSTPSLIDVVYKTYNVAQLMQLPGSTNNYYTFSMKVISALYKTVAKIICSKIHATYYDKLLINYTPLQILGFKDQFYSSQSVSYLTQNSIQFYSETLKQYELTQDITLKRSNIGQILGIFFSYFTILILMFTFMIVPVLQYNYKLDLCKKIYDNHQLNQVQVSLLTFCKYLCSNLKKGIFLKQDIIAQSFERLEKDINLMSLLKNQCIMNKLIQQNQQIESTKKPQQQQQSTLQKQQNLEETIELFLEGESSLGDQKLLQVHYDHHNHHYRDSQGEQEQETQAQQNGNERHSSSEEIVFIVQCDEEFNQRNLIQQQIFNLDVGETTISLLANKGQGYKTSCNTILTMLLMIAVFLFLIFAGMFSISQANTIQTVIQNQDPQEGKSITLNPEDVIFRALKTSSFDNFILEVKLLNQNYDIIENITLLTDSACDQYVQGLNQTVGSGWLCLPGPLTLSNDGKNNKILLGMRFTFPSAFGFTSAKIQMSIRQYDIIDYQLSPSVTRVAQLFSPNQLKAYQIQLVNDQQDNYHTFYKNNLNAEPSWKGLSVEMLDNYQLIVTEENTIWNVIDTSWGIVILVFTILLTKITGYLNTKERERIIKCEENENRNDIASILAKQYWLLNKVFLKEIEQIKYFYKKKIYSTELKSKLT